METRQDQAALLSIATYLPAKTLSSADLAEQFPEWNVDKIEAKTGISTRHIAADDETAADMAAAAASKLFAQGVIAPHDFDFMILCTECPDYILPASACVLQERLGLPRNIGAFDINLGCSGFVYGLGLAKGLVETGQARNVLVLVSETYSKLMRHDDKALRTIFGDGAAAAWVGAVAAPQNGSAYIGRPLYGTDGRGAANLIVGRGAFRAPGRAEDAASYLHMNGPEIFRFTLDAVASNIRKCIADADLKPEDLDCVVPHQANAFMLESIRSKLGIPHDRFVINLRDTGNTVSATIPIALAEEASAGRLKPDNTVLLSGFGVGYSWASVLLRWHPQFKTLAG